jgi:hypothetical protein
MSQRPRSRGWKEGGRTVAQLAALAIFGAGLVWTLVWIVWWGPRSADARDASACAKLYAAAATAADTARVDKVWPSGPTLRLRNSGARLRCGALRAAGQVPIG